MKNKFNKRKYIKPQIRITKMRIDFFNKGNLGNEFNLEGEPLLEAHWSGRTWCT